MPRNKHTKANVTPQIVERSDVVAEPLQHRAAPVVKPSKPISPAAKSRLQMRMLQSWFGGQPPAAVVRSKKPAKVKRAPKAETGKRTPLISAKKRAIIEQHAQGLNNLFRAGIATNYAGCEMHSDLVLTFKGHVVTSIRLLTVSGRDSQSVKQQERAIAEFERRSDALRTYFQSVYS